MSTCPVLGAVAADTSTVVVADFRALVMPEVRPVAVPVRLVATPADGVPMSPPWKYASPVPLSSESTVRSWALVVACDFPFVSEELFGRLASVREGFEAVAPIQNDGIPQPLCSLYRVEPCLRLAKQMIESGERKPITLLQSVRTRWLSWLAYAMIQFALYATGKRY